MAHEIGLALTLLLNAAAFAGAYRFARRHGTAGALQAACDAFLIYFIIQYASVALPGVVGAFNVWTMSIIALTFSAALWFTAGKSRAPCSRRDCASWTWDHFALVACAAFVVAYTLAHVFDHRYNPPAATDALVYHLPTAVQWIQTGRLGLFPAWYWNPAATYSPATSSTFMAWLMAPTGNDLFARFVQTPALWFVFVLVARLARELGCSRAVAGLVATAAVMSRPFISEALIPKDDLFVTAFFAAAVLSLAPSNLKSPLGPWRVGLSFGMMLACKYTVLLACPLFLFMADAPLRARWRWRDWAIALGTGAVLFAPWYVRNIALTGNPLYPVDVKLFGMTLFPGLFGTEPDQQLRSAGGVWKMLATTYHSVPLILLAALGVGWILALVAAGKAAVRDPLRRACVVGSAVTFIVFIVTSPHHEVRYMYPLLALMFAVTGLAIARWIRPEPTRVAVAAALAGAALLTAFKLSLLPHVTELMAQALVVTLAFVGFAILQARVLKLDRPVLATIAAGLVFLAALPTYVYWTLFVEQVYRKASDGQGQAGISYLWSGQYPAEAPLWTFVRENVPDDATIAVANTFFVYPFQDSALRRRLGYAPLRRGLHDFVHFPRLGDTVPGDLIVQRMTEAMNTDPDEATWLENLRRMNAEYLVIAAFEHEPAPPERRFVADNPGLFEPVFDSPAGSVYRLRQKIKPAANVTNEHE